MHATSATTSGGALSLNHVSFCPVSLHLQFKALVDLFNQTTGGPRDVYRGAFEGLDEFKASSGAMSRRETSRNEWKHMDGWESILTAHTSTLALCTELKIDGNVNFTRSLCYENINASAVGPRFPDPRWSIIEDCCLKFNRTVCCALVRQGSPACPASMFLSTALPLPICLLASGVRCLCPPSGRAWPRCLLLDGYVSTPRVVHWHGVGRGRVPGAPVRHGFWHGPRRWSLRAHS
jgi:hypothetical protein